MVDSPLSQDPVLLGIAKKHGTSVSTILISWSVQRGVVALPKSVNPERESSLGYPIA